jgi:hypothetical protein
MGSMRQLGEIVRQIASLDQDAVIYAAQPWTNESTAIVAEEPESGGVPEPAARQGLKYFLEVFLASEFLADWESMLGRTPTDQERCERLIRYAIDDV